MQKCFVVRNGGQSERSFDLEVVNNFIGKTGQILSVTPSRPIDVNREFGSWFIVADDGKSNNPLD